MVRFRMRALRGELREAHAKAHLKLLRVLNNGEFQPLGSTRTLHTDARILSSTNRDIETMVAVLRSGEIIALQLDDCGASNCTAVILTNYFVVKITLLPAHFPA